ncbi:MAG TPA: alanine racemase [Stellaceae bacterium]|nr:alanine racemase [Stellaceae bacterium]
MSVDRRRPPARAADRAGSILEIDLDAIAANWRNLGARLGPATRLAAVVKADAYGLGAARVAPALAAAGCRLFFVATIDEGIALRRTLPAAEIAVFNGLVPAIPGEFARARLMPVLNDLGQVESWRRFARRRGDAPAMLHIDTGMARLGLSKSEVALLLDEPERLHGVSLAAILSHLANAGDPADPMNAAQRDTFRAALARLPHAPASLAASSGIFLGADFHFDFARSGAALYGVNPLARGLNPMRQVVHLKARILQVRDIDRGESVGYGAAHRMERAGRVATVAVGYADGWLRSASHRGHVGIAVARAPVIGRISMDLLTIDVTGIDPELARPGNFVDLLDERYGVDEAAAAAGTIGYEILTALGRRALRVYRGAG